MPRLAHAPAPLNVQEKRALDAFVAEPNRLLAWLNWLLDLLRLGECAGRRADSACLADRRFAANQVATCSYLPLGARGPREIHIDDLCPPRPESRRTGVIPPGVRIYGNVTSDRLSPHTPLPNDLYIRGNLKLMADANPEPEPWLLPSGLTVTEDVELLCRADGPSFVAGDNIHIGGKLGIGTNPLETSGANRKAPIHFWDVHWSGDLEVANNITMVGVACHLPKTMQTRASIHIENARVQKTPGSIRAATSLILNNVSGMAHLLQVHARKFFTIRSCPDFVDLGTGASQTDLLQLFGNRRLETLPQGLTVSGSLTLIGNRIKSMPSDVTVGGFLFICYEPLTDLGANLRVGDTLTLVGLANFTRMPYDLDIARHLKVFDCPIAIEFPKVLNFWRPLRFDFSGKREVALFRTPTSADSVWAATKDCPNTFVVKYPFENQNTLNMISTLRNPSALQFDLSFLPTCVVDVDQQADLNCPITGETYADLYARGTAAVIVEGQTLRVYDFPSFVQAWTANGRNPMTRQLMTPFDLDRPE